MAELRELIDAATDGDIYTDAVIAALLANPDVVLRALGYRQHGFICLDSKCGTWTEDDSECPMGHDTDDPLPAEPFYVKAGE